MIKITIIILFAICLFIGNRLANMDKPMKMWLPEDKNELEFMFELDSSVIIDSILTVDDADEVWFSINSFKCLTMEFPDGHEETIDLEALQQAGSLEAYFKENK